MHNCLMASCIILLMLLLMLFPNAKNCENSSNFTPIFAEAIELFGSPAITA